MDNYQKLLEIMKQERDVAQAKADRLQEDLHKTREKLKSSRQETQVLRRLIYLCGSALTDAWILGTKMIEDVSGDEEDEEGQIVGDVEEGF
jgi:hypothetical protein